ncbi:MAG: nitronate monooxygenase [Candidatus Lambdaproteobacteria bacterium]|nr:nitronate monooxygenase [Candidatus Lambdaproteobacteria bacterium]
MFIVSGIELVVACCEAGVLGTFPTLNARSTDELGRWLERIAGRLAEFDRAHPQAPAAPFGVNLIMRSERLQADLEQVVAHQVPVVIPSVGNPAPVVERVHAYGGLVFADVATVHHARRAASAGLDGLILLCAGAGGNTGWLNPFAFVAAVREFYAGPLVVAGSIANGRAVRAVETLGADYAYVGSRFIPTRESSASDKYRELMLRSDADDVILTTAITGIPSNMLRGSLEDAGFFAGQTPRKNPFYFDRTYTTRSAWKDVWSAGHAVGESKAVASVQEVVGELLREYRAAR